MRLFRYLLLAGGAAVVSDSAAAQSVSSEALTPQASTRPLTLGSLQLYPSVGIRDVGVDSNVYNASQRVQEDFTYTVAPRVMAVQPIGDARLVGTGGLGFVFFRTNKDQQSLSGSVSGLFDVPSGRIRPSILGAVARTRQRSGDIDVRALTVAKSGRAGLDVAVGGVTSLTGWASREQTHFAPGELFRGTDLGLELNRATTTFAGGLRFDLTPLTSVVAAGELEQVRFTTARYRDADGVRLAPTVRFAEGAIVTGEIFAGLRDFRPLQSVIPRFRGLIAGGNLRYTLLGVTRFEGRLTRDLFYSFDEAHPYYLESGGQMTVAQRVVGPLEAIVLGGRRRLRYQTRLGATTAGGLETVSTWGGGLGVRLEEGMRLTFTVDRERRVSSGSALRQYDRTRAFASLEYQP